MSTQEIKSNTIAAQGAISQLLDIDTNDKQNQTVEFSYSSGIAGMENARQTTNHLLDAIAQFTEVTCLQANKFPEIAEKIAKRDVDIAKRWGS